MPLYRATNERGAIATGVAAWDRLDGVDALLSWGPPPTAGVPASVRFLAAWDHRPRDAYSKADVVLPAATFAERQGSYANLEGTVQFLRPPVALRPPQMEGWAVLAELAGALGMALDYPGIAALQREIASKVPALAAVAETPRADPEPQPVLTGPAHP